MRGKLQVAALLIVVLSSGPALAQNFDDLARGRARDMLKTIADDIRKNYYDPKMHGFDFEARVREADEKLKKATSLSQGMSIIAWTLDGLDDSHTYFIPPARTTRIEYGWRMQMVGERCFVTHVRPKSDAEGKGLKPGDEILSVNGTVPTRDNFAVLEYILNVLFPRPVLELQIRTAADGQARTMQVAAKVRQLQKLVDLTSDTGIWNMIREMENADRMTRVRCTDVGKELEICKMPDFELEDDKVRELIGFARKKKGLILDLRDNPGGAVTTLDHMIGGFFDHEVKVGDRVGRKPMKPQMAKGQHDPFTGQLVVLVDSNSASAAELFARVMQLEKRGTVLGDRSAGLVMEGRPFSHQVGIDTIVPYGVVVTDADLVMTDGKSLERRGVTPDEVLLPGPADLLNNRDPALARAAEMLGVKMTPEEAAKLFPYEWPKD